MKLNKLSALVASSVLLASASTTVMAESEWESSASVALSSEYVWRGISQTQSDPAISGSFDLAHESGLYTGVWASNLDFGGGASIEVDYYAGISGDLGSGFSYDVGGLYYDYPSEESLDFAEVYGSLSFSFFTVGAAYTSWADDDDYEGNVYYSFGASYDIGQFNLASGIGYYDLTSDLSDYYGVDGYNNFYLGTSTEFGGFGFDLTYSSTDGDAEDIFDEALVDSTFIFTISKSM